MEEKITGIFLINVKRAFDHVSRNKLMRKMEMIGADSDIVRWTCSFVSE